MRRTMADTMETTGRTSSRARRLAGVLGFAAAMGAVLTAGSPAATALGSSPSQAPAVARPAATTTQASFVERATAAANAAPPAPAPAPVAPAPDLTTPEGKGAAALELIGYPVEKTGYTVVFAGPRPGFLGLMEPPLHRITIFVRETQSVADVAHVLGHELGHVVDLTLTTPEERLQYRAIRGLDPRRSWFPNCDACTDYSFPAGDFAETFSVWLLGGGTSRSTMAGSPDAAQLAQLDAIFSA